MQLCVGCEYAELNIMTGHDAFWLLLKVGPDIVFFKMLIHMEIGLY